jgi:hypothetical protein
MNKEELYNRIKERQPNIGKYIYSTICEDYYIGWRLIGNMLENGWSLLILQKLKKMIWLIHC